MRTRQPTCQNMVDDYFIHVLAPLLEATDNNTQCSYWILMCIHFRASEKRDLNNDKFKVISLDIKYMTTAAV